MSRALQLARRHWFKVAAVVVVAYVFIFHVEWDEFGLAFAGVSWLFVFLAVMANLSSIMFKVASWKIIFDYVEGFHGRWRDLTSAVMIGFLVNALVPARMGEVARAYTISRREAIRGKDISRSTVVGTIVLERVSDGVVMALLVIYGIAQMDLPSWARRGAIALIAISFSIAALLVALELKREKISSGAAVAAAGRREHHPWWRRLSVTIYGVIARFSEGQQVLRSPLRVASIFSTTSTAWISQLMAVFFSLHAFQLGGNTFEDGITRALLLLILINVAGALPATPGNVGVFQLATVIPLVATYDISKTTALAFSIGLQAIEGSIGVGLGSLSLLREGLTLKQVRSQSVGEFSPAEKAARRQGLPEGESPRTAARNSNK